MDKQDATVDSDFENFIVTSVNGYRHTLTFFKCTFIETKLVNYCISTPRGVLYFSDKEERQRAFEGLLKAYSEIDHQIG